MKGRISLEWIILLILALGVAVLYGCVAEQPVERASSACYRTDGGDKWICGSGGEMELQSGATLDVQSGATFSIDSISVTTQTVTSLTASGTVQGEHLYSTDDAVVSDTLTANSAAITTTLSVGGDVELENDETLSNSSDGIVTIDGEWGYLQYLVDKSAAYTTTAAESGAIFTNDGAGAAISITLPAAAEGLVYGFLAQDDQDLLVHPDGSEQILSCTDAGGASCNLDDQYDFTWLVSDGTGWLPFGTVGTLTDQNDE